MRPIPGCSPRSMPPPAASAWPPISSTTTPRESSLPRHSPALRTAASRSACLLTASAHGTRGPPSSAFWRSRACEWTGSYRPRCRFIFPTPTSAIIARSSSSMVRSALPAASTSATAAGLPISPDILSATCTSSCAVRSSRSCSRCLRRTGPSPPTRCSWAMVRHPRPTPSGHPASTLPEGCWPAASAMGLTTPTSDGSSSCSWGRWPQHRNRCGS